jgi:hypothetical protein
MSPTLKEPETAAEWRCAHAAEATACDLLRAERASLRAERDAALADVSAAVMYALDSVAHERARALAAEAERDAALADVTAWRGFAGSVAVAVHPDGTGAVIADHLAVDDLPDLLAAVERVVVERGAALARVGTAERDRDIFRGAFLTTKTERAAALAERDAALAERDRLRAVIAEAAAALPLHPEGAHLTPPEADAEAVRVALLAALRGEA